MNETGAYMIIILYYVTSNNENQTPMILPVNRVPVADIHLLLAATLHSLNTGEGMKLESRILAGSDKIRKLKHYEIIVSTTKYQDQK